MDLPEYVSRSEVQRVCQELGIEDWTTLTVSKVSLEEASIIRDVVGGEALLVSAEEFQLGLEVELEHGIQFPDANVTNNHPILTGKIVLAHLKEMLDYYLRLEVAEIEGDLFKAFNSKNLDKALKKYQSLLSARRELVERENEAISGR